MSDINQRSRSDNQKPIEWSQVRRILVVRLRSIGDTVLATPSLIALKRFLPDAEVDILLEDWVAPVLEGFGDVDKIIAIPKSAASRIRVAAELRKRKYDVAINLHGGTTATFFTAVSGARYRVGYSSYQYSFLYNHLLSKPSDFWGRERLHSAEQQLALLGFVGVPVESVPKSQLAVVPSAAASLDEKLRKQFNVDELPEFALMHPAAAFATKQWAASNFAEIANILAGKGIRTVAVAGRGQGDVLRDVRDRAQRSDVITFDDLSLPEISALAQRAKLFVGNDSGIAHMAAAVDTPTIVVFGSSNRDHWRPWTDAPNEIVFEPMPCQPCAGYECKLFGRPKCILGVSVEAVAGSVERILAATKKKGGS